MIFAKDIIIEASKTHPVIFINEVHRTLYHRAFTLSLLQALYDQGFRYFAAEALSLETRSAWSEFPITAKNCK